MQPHERYQKIQEALAKAKNKKSIIVNNNIKKPKLLKKENMPKIVQNKNTRPHVLNVKSVFKPPNYSLYSTPNWFTSSEEVDVSIIVPLYNSQEVIIDQIKNWHWDEQLTSEIIYVNDACPQNSYLKILENWKNSSRKIGKIVLNETNGGFSFACNIGAKFAKGKYLIFLNADCIVTENWLSPLILSLQEDQVGLVGPMLLRKGNIESLGSEWINGSFMHIGKQVYKQKPLSKPLKHSEIGELKRTNVEMVTGACLGISHELFKEVKGFDTSYRIGYWEDADLNMKVRMLGKDIVCEPSSIVYHKVSHSGAGGHPWMTENKNIFYNRWVNNKSIELGKHESYQGKVVVYTAIAGDYDRLKDDQFKDNADFVAFLDKPIESNTWQVRPIQDIQKDLNRTAKRYKVLSHDYFPEYDYSLWIDGSVSLKAPIRRIISSFAKDYDLLVFQHPERRCLYAEAEACLNQRLDDKNTIKNQIERYKKENYPANNGLVEATILLRKNNEKVREFNEMWWDEIQKGSRRDQISFNYCAKKVGLKFGFFPGTLRIGKPNTSSFFIKRNHHKPRN